MFRCTFGYLNRDYNVGKIIVLTFGTSDVTEFEIIERSEIIYFAANNVLFVEENMETMLNL